MSQWNVLLRRLAAASVLVLGLTTIATTVPASAVNVPQPVVVSDNPVNWTPHVVDGRVNAIVQIGNTVFAGGEFTQVRQTANGANISRDNLFAFNATTGVIDQSFAPNLDRAVLALAESPDGNLFAGGNFNRINGASSLKLVKIDADNGQRITSFTAVANSRVRDLIVRGNTLYVSGNFTQLAGQPRQKLGAVDATTGAIDPNLNLPITDPRMPGTTPGVYSMDVSPDGTKLLAIGNFTRIDGIERWQAGMIDLSTTPASVADWETDRFRPTCASVFDTYMRDVDFSADGSYFALVTTGAYSGGANAGSLCDTTSRWETANMGQNLDPTWASYTGGDTLYSVAVTGTAIYVGGHNRWVNNPFRGDAPGPGAVPREGIAALDPVNGLPFTWDPGRARGVGVFALHSTPEGLWVGSDTDRLGGETHRKLGMFPVAGGTAIPPTVTYELPGDLFNSPLSSCPGADTDVRYRVNAAGPTVAAADCGPDWSSDTGASSSFRNSGSNTATWANAPTRLSSVPSTAPTQLFLTERWDPGASPEMQWSFNVPAGTNVEVRLYFNNGCTCTDNPGERLFDVRIDGTLALDDFDIVAAAQAESPGADGHEDAIMRSFPVTSDGVVDILFEHVVENPLIDAIEIVNAGWTPVFPPAVDALDRRSFDGAAVGPHGQLPTPGFDWSTARGAMVVDGVLYHGTGDGRLVARAFDGSALGSGQTVELYGLTNFPLPSVTGMFFDTEDEQLYYTVSGDANLYRRAFTPESRVVGAQTFPVGGSVNWATARGMTMSGGRIYFARTDGNLYSVDFSSGIPSGAASIVVPAGAGYDWASTGMFVFGDPSSPDATPPSRPGEPSGVSTSSSTIDLTWSGSTDDVSDTLTYHVFRDGVEVDTLASNQATVAYQDGGLAPGSTHTYHVVAEDAAGNDSQPSPTSDPIQVQSGAGAIFSDGFSSGDFAAWTSVTSLTIDGADGAPAAPSARGTPSAQRAFAYRDLGSTHGSGCLSVNVNAADLGGSTVDLFRLRSASGGPIVKVFVNATGVLRIRDDFGGTQRGSGVALGSGWHNVELCGVVGSTGSWDLYRDGVEIVDAWVADTGADPIGRIQIGDSRVKTWTINFDEVVFDQEAG